MNCQPFQAHPMIGWHEIDKSSSGSLALTPFVCFGQDSKLIPGSVTN
jgi:hypothetical protein